MLSYRIDSKLGEIQVRPRELRDIEAHLDYLYQSPKEFLEGIGFDTGKFLPREEMRKHIAQRATAEKPLAMAAEWNGKTVALVFLDPNKDNPEDAPRLHFHILNSNLRGQNLGGPIFLAAVKGLSVAHKIDRFVIEPRSSNEPMNALMQKLGFKRLGERTLPPGPMTQEIHVHTYEVLAPQSLALSNCSRT